MSKVRLQFTIYPEHVEKFKALHMASQNYKYNESSSVFFMRLVDKLHAEMKSKAQAQIKNTEQSMKQFEDAQMGGYIPRGAKRD